MVGRFSFSSNGGLRNPWFRLGNLDIGSAAFVALACAVAMIVGAFFPALIRLFVLNPRAVRSGEVWRIATWPLASAVSIWTGIAIALLWYIGTMLESRSGRDRMAFLLGALTIVTGLIAVALNTPTGGADALEIVIILLFIAEDPHRPFFFGIPGWVLGVFFVTIQTLQLIQGVATGGPAGVLLLYLATLLLGALLGRAIGLLDNYPFIPRIPLPAGLSGRKTTVSRKAKGAPQRNHRGRVVEGPWAAEPVENSAADQAELDGLLDKISASGLESLSRSEKQRLNELSKKLR